jgi:hypothetical protein
VLTGSHRKRPHQPTLVLIHLLSLLPLSSLLLFLLAVLIPPRSHSIGRKPATPMTSLSRGADRSAGWRSWQLLRQFPFVDARPSKEKDAGGRTRKKRGYGRRHPSHARSLIMYIYPFLDTTRTLPILIGSRISAHPRSIVHHRLHPTTRISWSPTHPAHKPANPQHDFRAPAVQK